MKTHEATLSAGKIYGIEQEDGTCSILCDCQTYPGAMVRFSVPLEAARTYFDAPREQRPSVQYLFPDLPAAHREILISGISPAAFDQLRAPRKMPKTISEFKERYEPLGYEFE